MKSPFLIRPLFACSAVIALLLSGGAATAAEDKWEITSSMEMTGMPFQMPAQKQTLCLPQNQPVNEKMVPAKDNCEVSKFVSTGNTSRFHIECAPPEQMSGDGEFTRLGNDAYKGSMSMRGNFDGRQADMKMSYSGKKIGVCGGEADNAYNPQKMMQQSQALLNSTCKQMVDALAWQAAPSMMVICPTIQADICASAKTLFDAAATSSESMLELQESHADWRDLATWCGMDANAVSASACASAKRARNWNDAVLLCGVEDTELLARAKSDCAGFDLTSVRSRMDANTLPLCDAFAEYLPRTPRAAPAAAPGESAAGLIDSGAGAVDTGERAVDAYKKFKGLFGR